MTIASPHSTSSPMEVSADLSPDGNASSPDTPMHSTPQDAAGTPGVSHSASGATVIDPSVEPSSTLNPRSCVTCRRRKVRCDKHMPCGNCRKAHISCVFPAPGRAPRRPRPRDPNAPPKQTSAREAELVKRLRKLEGIVEELSGQIEVETRNLSSAGESPDGVMDPASEAERRRETHGNNMMAANLPLPPGPERLINKNDKTWGSLKNSPTGASKEFGRLVLNDGGKTRYFSNAFWAKMNDELDQLRADAQRFTDDESEESGDEHSSPATVRSQKEPLVDHHSFVLGYRSSDVDLRKLHPLPSQIPFIWLVYTENVDPVVKILHVPTMRNIIRKLRTDLDSLSPAMEALMFSIYYAAITSMEEDEVKMNFGAEKSQLIQQYRFATEQALAKANFLNTLDIVVVQAFTLFLVLVRRHDETRFSWTLTGLLIRISQSLGIHREGTHFANLSPFDIEMRRRLWWAICVLDLRAAEDQGTELTITERTHDTQFPLNINDDDIHPDMKEFPRERAGFSDLTFCLIRYEICSFARKMHLMTSSVTPCPNASELTLKEREDMLIELHNLIEEKYLNCQTSQDTQSLQWVAATLARLIVAKMSLIIYQPILFNTPGEKVSQEIRDRLFASSTEVVEYNRVLNTETRAKQYHWMIQTYTQWHAIGYLLLEVSRRPWSSSVERAWVALNNTFQSPEPYEHAKLAEHKAVWLPLRKLMVKANRHRDAEISRLRSDPQAARQLDLETSNKILPANFINLPSSVRSTFAQAHWRKLVGLPTTVTESRGGCFGDKPPVSDRAPNTETASSGNVTVGQSQLGRISENMTQPWFSSPDLWPMAMNQDSTEMARQAIFGNNSSLDGLAQQQVPTQGVPHMSSTGSPTTSKGGIAFPREALSPASRSATQTTAMPQTTVLAAATGMDTPVDDNPPPWLWPNAWKWADSDVATNLLPTDEGDINMEEEFNWQDWQQSIRGFELDAGLGLGMTGQGQGFSGGV